MTMTQVQMLQMQLTLMNEIERLNLIVGQLAEKGMLTDRDLKIADFKLEIKKMEARARTMMVTGSEDLKTIEQKILELHRGLEALEAQSV